MVIWNFVGGDMRKTGITRLLCMVIAISFIVSGCQTTSFYGSKHLARTGVGTRILLMPTDVELSEMNAGGITEPNARWTETAEKLITAILHDKMSKIGAKFTFYKLE